MPQFGRQTSDALLESKELFEFNDNCATKVGFQLAIILAHGVAAVHCGAGTTALGKRTVKVVPALEVLATRIFA
jgi:hypothetical protein